MRGCRSGVVCGSASFKMTNNWIHSSGFLKKMMSGSIPLSANYPRLCRSGVGVFYYVKKMVSSPGNRPPPQPSKKSPPRAPENVPPDAHTAISVFKCQLAPMLQNQQKGLVLAGNSKDDCQQKQQAVVHVTDATKDVITMAQKMHDAIGDSRKERRVEFSTPLVKHLAMAICTLAKQRHTLGFYELRGACKQLGHHRQKSSKPRCVIAKSASPGKSDNPGAQTGRAPHKAKEHIKRLKKGAKVNPLLRFTYPLYNDNTYAIGRTPETHWVVMEDDEDDGDTNLWGESQLAIEKVYRILGDSLSTIGESKSSYDLTSALTEFVCLLDLVVTVEEYKLDGKKQPWPNFKSDFISQAGGPFSTEKNECISDWMTQRRNPETLSKLIGRRHIKS